MLLNSLPHTGQAPTTKKYLVQNVSRAEVEEPCCRLNPVSPLAPNGLSK